MAASAYNHNSESCLFAYYSWNDFWTRKKCMKIKREEKKDEKATKTKQMRKGEEEKERESRCRGRCNQEEG